MVRERLVGQRPWVVIDSAEAIAPLILLHTLPIDILLLFVPINILIHKTRRRANILTPCTNKISAETLTLKKLTRRDGECEEGSGSGEEQYPGRASPSSARPWRDVASIPVFPVSPRLHIEDHVSRLLVRPVEELVLVVRDASTPSWWPRLLNVANTRAAADSVLDYRAVIHGLQERPRHRVLHSSACPRRNGDRDCGSATTFSGVLTYDTQRSRGSAAKRHHHDLARAEPITTTTPGTCHQLLWFFLLLPLPLPLPEEIIVLSNKPS